MLIIAKMGILVSLESNFEYMLTLVVASILAPKQNKNIINGASGIECWHYFVETEEQ